MDKSLRKRSKSKNKRHKSQNKSKNKRTNQKEMKIFRFNEPSRNSSYSPTVNRQLITLKTLSREKLHNCNIKRAFRFKEPLEIGIPGFIYGKTCFNYKTSEAKEFLLKNLSANKHLNINIIVPPKQAQSNCWFNAMFVMFFISDKGRKFFHFLRQLMIEGKQLNGKIIPENIRNAFALLNFGIDASLTGNPFAYELNTNTIIHKLYNSIPNEYKKHHKYITDINNPGNPLKYYISIINYLACSPILLVFVSDANTEWKQELSNLLKHNKHLPHIIAIEIYKENANTLKKPLSFIINEAKYEIDSAAIIDISKQHFCATITCEGKEMSYDGMSHHPLVPFKWKEELNNNSNWGFKGHDLKWNFTDCYQILMYYRVT